MLTFGELALFASTLEAELFAFFFAGVTTEQVGALQCCLEIDVHDGQCFGNAEADGLDLTVVTATTDVSRDGVGVFLPQNRKWLVELG